MSNKKETMDIKQIKEAVAHCKKNTAHLHVLDNLYKLSEDDKAKLILSLKEEIKETNNTLEVVESLFNTKVSNIIPEPVIKTESIISVIKNNKPAKSHKAILPSKMHKASVIITADEINEVEQAIASGINKATLLITHFPDKSSSRITNIVGRLRAANRIECITLGKNVSYRIVEIKPITSKKKVNKK